VEILFTLESHVTSNSSQAKGGNSYKYFISTRPCTRMSCLDYGLVARMKGAKEG
jgi:hypothetical protein